MALTDESSGIPATMLVGPTGFGGTPYPVYQGNGGGFGSNGSDGWWIILLLLALGGGWGGNFGGGFGGYGNMMLGYDFPWLLNGQQGINTRSGYSGDTGRSRQSEQAETQSERYIEYNSGSEFSEAIDGMDALEVWPIIDELMSVIQATNIRLYNGVMRKIEQL